jgi:outer membrane protein TolC
MKPYRQRLVAFVFVLGILVTRPCLHAQQASPTPNAAPVQDFNVMKYGNTRWFPTFWDPYQTPYVPQTNIKNSGRLHALLSDGKLHLSVDDTLALVLENNLDISVARYQPAFAETDLLRAKSGGAPRGVQGAFVSQALYSGAIGGGLSSASSTSSSVSGGGLTGGGTAFSLGAVPCCDPSAGVSIGWNRATSPLNYTVVSGIPVVTTQTTNVAPYFVQGFLTGTSYVVALPGYTQNSTSANLLFNPVVPTTLYLGLYQHLLNGFGRRANAKFIRIAQNDVRISQSVFRQQVITTVAQVLNLYWDFLSDNEQVAVAQQSLAYSQKLLADNKRQVEIGTLAPIEVVRAESEVATDQQNLIVAQTNVEEQGELIKTALAKKVDGDLVSAQVDPVDKLPEPRTDDIPPLDKALEIAAQNRPEIEQADLNLRYQDIVIKANRNALLPTLDFFATYAGSGLSGVEPVYGTCPAGYVAAATECVNATSGATTPLPITGSKYGGAGQALSQIFHNDYPNYSVGLSLAVPIRNRSAQADAARALLEQRQLLEQLQRTKNQVEQDVRNAEIGVIQAKARIEAARKAVALSRQTLDAEQKKFQLGESTVFLVIQAQRDLTTAEGNEVQARSTYAKALTQFRQVTGTILSDYNIELNDALQGKVTHAPNIPGSADTPRPVNLN